MIKAIIFDWGGVLIDNPANGLMEYCAKYLNVDVNRLKNIFSQYESVFQKGEISEKVLWNKVCTELNINKPSSESLWKKAVKQVFKDKIEVYHLIKLLKKEGYKIGFLSNTEIPAMEYFFEKGYQKFFDVTLFSCAENTVKPEEKIYNLILSKLEVKPEEAIFIDDKLDYIEGAKKVGLNGIVFKTSEQLVKELALYSININVAKIQTVPSVVRLADSPHNTI
ncbi:MAG: HAD family phosphatase [Candidatus Woesearchaeota archaeon]